MPGASAQAPPPVHHLGFPRAARTAPGPAPVTPLPAAAPAAAASMARPRAAPSTAPRHRPADREAPADGGLAWLPYLIVLAGAAAGLFVAWQGPRYAGPGTALVGCALLAAALARLLLPPRYARLLSTRRKAPDVMTFAVLGAAVLAFALTLP